MLIGVHWFAMYSQNSKVWTVRMEMVFDTFFLTDVKNLQ